MAKQFLESNRPSRDARFADRVLRLASPDPSDDAGAIYNLFEAEDHPARDQWRAGRLADSHADWGTSRVAFARDGDGGEQLVAALTAYDLTMRIGNAQVRAAGINGDVVHPDIAGQRGEILEQAAAAAVGAMRNAGYDLAIAFDDDALWLNQGFTRGWRALTWRVAVADLPAGAAPELERIDAVHRDDLAAAYNVTHGDLTGTVRRPTYRLNKHPGLFKTYRWNAVGDTTGYVSVDPESSNGCLWVDELAGDAGECLTALRSIAGGLDCEDLLFDRLHYKSPVGVRLRQMSSCRLATGTRLGKARWYLLRIVDLKSTMTKLAPMLHERLRASELADWHGTLSIELRANGAEEAVTLAVQEGGVKVQSGATGNNTIAGNQAIAQLLLGTEDPAEIVAVNGIALHGDAKRLLPVLFPPQHPQMENQAL